MFIAALFTIARTWKKLKLNGSMKTLQDLLELTPKKAVLFIIGDWNAKEGSGSGLMKAGSEVAGVVRVS